MSFLYVLMWLHLACVHYVLTLAAAILEAMADDIDVVMCWLENRQ